MKENIPEDEVKWVPVNDGCGIIGYDWKCKCGHTMRFASTGDECPKCGFVIPDIDPDEWIEKVWKEKGLIKA